MSTSSGPLARWAIFVRERYEPVTHLAMGTAFTVGNAGVALAQTSAAQRVDRVGWPPLALSAALVVLFFLRLRIFDEIKDYRTDLAVNPDRPLARGLISVAEARRAAWLVACVEILVVALIGWAVAGAWGVAFGYSLAMYREFGVGSWLRPRMELYALSHTFVAALLGVSVACAVTGVPPWQLPWSVWAFAPANWALFNVFEFSRKTFAPAEEALDAESYSLRWGPAGAAAITLTWCGAGLVSLGATGTSPILWLGPGEGLLVFAAAAVILCASYVVRPVPSLARLFRISMSAWATVLYIGAGLTALGPGP